MTFLALPLQLLLRRRPPWVGHSVVVVAEDKPTGVILWANERALRARVWPGRRYAEGLSLDSGLRADVVGAAEIEAAVGELLDVLRQFSPEVEPSADEPGVCWLNATGVEGLFASFEDWANQLVAALRRARLRASVVVGFDRFGTYALARAGGGVQILGSKREERRCSDRVSLHRLGLDAGLRDALHRLGVDDVGAFRKLPRRSLHTRFGVQADRLHRLAHGALAAPLAPRPEPLAVCERMECEPGEHEIDVHGLVFLCKQRLARIARALGERGLAVAALHLKLLFEKAPPRQENIRPAEPTLDEVQLVDLLRLRLEAIQLDAELEGFELTAETMAATVKQKQLFVAARRRDLDAANRALARGAS